MLTSPINISCSTQHLLIPFQADYLHQNCTGLTRGHHHKEQHHPVHETDLHQAHPSSLEGLSCARHQWDRCVCCSLASGRQSLALQHTWGRAFSCIPSTDVSLTGLAVVEMDAEWWLLGCDTGWCGVMDDTWLCVFVEADWWLRHVWRTQALKMAEVMTDTRLAVAEVTEWGKLARVNGWGEVMDKHRLGVVQHKPDWDRGWSGDDENKLSSCQWKSFLQ